MANDEYTDTPILFESPASRPLAEPSASDFKDDSVCDICGRSFNGKHGVSMHKTLVHGVPGAKRKRGRPPGSKNKARAATPAKIAPSPRRIVLNEQWSDQNGRILLTDQDGNWWVAKKLDV